MLTLETIQTAAMPNVPGERAGSKVMARFSLHHNARDRSNAERSAHVRARLSRLHSTRLQSWLHPWTIVYAAVRARAREARLNYWQTENYLPVFLRNMYEG